MSSCKDPDMDSNDREDLCATFYSRREVKAMQEDVLEDLKGMLAGVPEGDNLTYRGIEHLITPEINQIRRVRRRAYIDAVLLEQHRQWTQNESRSAELIDQRAIAMAATCLSLDDGLVAITKAKKDEDDAKGIMSLSGGVHLLAKSCSGNHVVSAPKIASVLGATQPNPMVVG